MVFKKITHNDKKIIEHYTKNWNIENNDYNFTTLYLWGKHGKIKYAEDAGVLYLYYDFPDNPRFFLPPVPEDQTMDYSHSVKTAISEMRKIGFEPCFRSVCDPFFKPLTESLNNIIIEHTPYNDDYVYLFKDLSELKGKKYHAKRNHINIFLSNNPNWEYIRISEENIDECMNLYQEWSEGKNETTLSDYDEQLTVELAIKHMSTLGLFGGGIRINGVLKAFSIGEKTSNNMITVHIEKADPSINGLFPMINQQFVINNCSGSYYPYRMIEKYKVTFVEN